MKVENLKHPKSYLGNCCDQKIGDFVFSKCEKKKLAISFLVNFFNFYIYIYTFGEMTEIRDQKIQC
jgi:hypothetical protein